MHLFPKVVLPFLLPLLLLLLLLLLCKHGALTQDTANAKLLFNTHTNTNRAVTSSKSKSNKFVIYDPHTGRQLEPFQYMPIVVGSKRKPPKPSGNLIELPQLWTPCTCTELMCMCCVGVRFGDVFNNKICVNIEYNAARLNIMLRINFNKRNIVTFVFSIRDPPSYCIPLVLPPVFACLRLYDLQAMGGNVQLCLMLVLQLLVSEIFEFRFNCIRFGVNGVQFVKPALPYGNMEIDGESSIEGLDNEGEGGQVRTNVQLDENYSGISVEQSDEDKDFIRIGKAQRKS